MSGPSESYRVVLTTAGSAAQAEAIARALVESRSAACVNVVPGVRSYFRWKGELSREEELLLVIKTEARLFDDVRRVIRETHDYDLPEVIAIPVQDGDADYLSWISEAVGEARGPS